MNNLFLKRAIFVMAFFTVFNFLYTNGLPKPKNNQLYTDYVSYKYTPYLKRPVITTGFIALDGKDKFVFKQLMPVEFVIKRLNEKITFKRAGMAEVVIDKDNSNAEYDFFFLFDEGYELLKEYNLIEKDIANGKKEFLITPKNKSNYSKIIVIAFDDKFESLELYFNNKTVLRYEFKNSITGQEIDKKYFE